MMILIWIKELIIFLDNMTKDELVKKLEQARKVYNGDPEAMHCEFDDLLIEYINDDRVRNIYDNSNLWWA